MMSASAPLPTAYAACTPVRWDKWYADIGALGAGGVDFDLLETVVRTRE